MQTVKALQQSLKTINVDYVEKRFRSDEGISGITTELFVSLKCIPSGTLPSAKHSTTGTGGQDLCANYVSSTCKRYTL